MGAPEVVMFDSMDACNEVDENAMEMSQHLSRCRGERSRSRGHDSKASLRRRRLHRTKSCRRRWRQQQHAHLPHSQATLPNPSSAGEGKDNAAPGGGTAKACDGDRGDVVSVGVNVSTDKDTAAASTLKELRNPIKNLQPEFLSAILESDNQLDYHTDALLRHYDTDCDKRLMIADLKDFLPAFYVQLGCDQPASVKLLDLFASSDLDRDGSLHRDEFKGFLRASLKQGREAHELSEL